MIQPPSIGPSVGASTARTPASVVAAVWPGPGKRRKTAAKTAGIITPPAKPCTIRQAINASKLPLAPHPAEASVNTASEPANISRSERTRVRKPVSGMATHLGDQIARLDPDHAVGIDAESGLDRRKGRDDDLDVEDRHEHAGAHRGEAGPDAEAGRPAAHPGRRVPGERPLLDAYPHGEYAGVEQRKEQRIGPEPEHQREHQDLRNDDTVVRMPHEAVGPRATSVSPGTTMTRVVQRGPMLASVQTRKA